MDLKFDLRARVKGILQGVPPPRPLFLPIVFSHAARIENLPLSAFLSNPTKITQSLRQLRSHLRSDGITCYFDPFLEAEALGASLQWGSGAQPSIRWPHHPLNGDSPASDQIPKRGRIPVAVEVTRRMKSLLRDELLLAVGLIGPYALAAQLDPSASSAAIEFASSAVPPIATAYLEAGANVVLIHEDMPPTGEYFQDWASQLATAVNVIRFYEALPVVLLNFVPEQLANCADLVLDCVVCPVFRECKSDSLEIVAKPLWNNLGVAIAISARAGSAPRPEITAENLQRLVSAVHPVVITTAGDVPDTLDLKELNKLRDASLV
jgi:hypothetical protein